MFSPSLKHGPSLSSSQGVGSLSCPGHCFLVSVNTLYPFACELHFMPVLTGTASLQYLASSLSSSTVNCRTFCSGPSGNSTGFRSTAVTLPVLPGAPPFRSHLGCYRICLYNFFLEHDPFLPPLYCAHHSPTGVTSVFLKPVTHHP